MSSLRNAVQRRNHRERAQPQEREKWGLLEKRKDYKLRAADHKLKKRKINALKEKASERNEDEFYFGMMSASTDGGIKRSKRSEENSGGGGKVLSLDVVKLMKTQDQGYLQTILQRTTKERERVEQELVLAKTGVSTTASGRKIAFDENGEDVSEVPGAFEGNEDPEAELDFSDEGSSSSLEEDESLSPEERQIKEQTRHNLEVQQRKLTSLQDQERKLATALRHLDDQRARMNNTIGGVNKNGVRWKQRQRKR